MKNKIILILLILFTPISVFAITGTGTSASGEKKAIYPFGAPTCSRSPDSYYYHIGGVFLRDGEDESETSTLETNYLESKDVYSNEITAEEACNSFVLSHREDEYICADYPARTAYQCKGTINDPSSQSDYLEDYIDGGKLFATEGLCIETCTGTCTLKNGNSFRYYKPSNDENSLGAVNRVGSKVYVTSDGEYAFCLQPAKGFMCPNKKMTPQYCLDSDFDLSSCKDNYMGDYRCGLAYIALTAAGEKTSESSSSVMSIEQYAAAEFAMRLWSTSVGYISGMTSTSYPLSLYDRSNTSVNFYAITASRVQKDANYLEYGIPCSTSSKNHGVVCDYDDGGTTYNIYKKGLALYKDALKINSLDAGGNKIPKLVTPTLADTDNMIQITNPTSEPCTIGDNGCSISITLRDASGKVVDASSTYCDKNYCYAEYHGERLCTSTSTQLASVEVTIKDFDANGNVGVYHDCAKPDSRQIMFVINASGSVTEGVDYHNTYATSVSCACDDDSASLQSSTNSPKSCRNKDDFDSDESDYDGYDTGLVKDPSMSTILNSCSGEKYFREKSYETSSDTCKIYCRKEIEFRMSTKEKVYSGMQFRYELEEKISNNLGADQHLTAIVYQKRQCVSEIYFDTPNDKGVTWLERFKAAESKVDDAWNEWKRWDTLKYEQEVEKTSPIEYASRQKCSANCNGIKATGYGSTSASGSVDASIAAECKTHNTTVTSIIDGNTGEYGERCEEINSNMSESTGNVCRLKCYSILKWNDRYYNSYSYPSDISTPTLSIAPTEEEAVGKRPVSGSYCVMNMWYDIIVDVWEEECEPVIGNSNETTTNCNWSDSEVRLRRTISDSSNLYLYDIIPTKIAELQALIDKKYHDTYDGNDRYRVTISPKVFYSLTSKNVCSPGKDGKIDYVIEKAEEALKAYNSAQAAVRDLLTELQACNMYGSGLEGEPDIKHYVLNKGPTGDGDGSSASGDAAGSNGGTVQQEDDSGNEGNCDPDKGCYIIDENITGVRNVNSSKADGTKTEYSSNTMLANPDDKYSISEVATTNNKASIKKKLLKSASCIDDTCVDLSVEYADKEFGDALIYSKNTGIIKTDELFNVYCEGSDCYRSVHTDEEDEELGFISQPYTTNVKRIVCDTTDPDPVNQQCKLENTVLPKNDYVSFKVTTEVDFYRDKNYYTKAFTGEVVESKSATKFSSKQYNPLGKNVYPVTRDIKSGSYDVNYSFTNLNISKFSSSDNSINLNTYEYDCSYEVYNNSTGYDCIVQYNADGTPKNDECSNFCFYVDDSVPDLRCIKWNASDDDSGYGFVYRNVDLENLFPNGREYGNNWSNATKIISEIQETGTDLYATTDHLVLSVTLNTDAIKKIREYNRFKNTNAGGYLDNSLTDCSLEVSLDGYNNRFVNCKSSFIDELYSGSGVLGVETNYINRIGSDKK